MLTVFADSEGKTFVPAQVAAELSALSPAPVYGPYDTFIGKGAVGGFIETFESVGTAAAEMAIEIMEGKDPADAPAPNQPRAALSRRLPRDAALGPQRKEPAPRH